MKLAYVYDAVYPWETGGVQKRVWELARRLAGDHDVHWFGLHYWDGPTIIEREGVTLHGVAEPRELYVNGRRSITEAIYFATHLIKSIRQYEFDLIDCQVFPYFSCYASKLSTAFTDSALVMTWHEVWQKYWYKYLGWKGIFGRIIERGAAPLPDEHVVVSKRTQRELQNLAQADSHLLPNGISMNSISSVTTADRQMDLLFVGRLIEEKNPAMVVRAVAQLVEQDPDFQCRIVGDGPKRDHIVQLIDDLELKNNVELLPFRDSHDEIIALMKSADVFVLPSRREGFGMTVLEALACGTPVVTLDHPRNAAADLVDDDYNGYTVDYSSQAIADGVRRADRSIDSSDCIDSAAEYNWERIVTEAETVYAETR